VIARNEPHRAQIAVYDPVAHVDIVGLEMDAVGNAQRAVVGLGRRDHRLAFGAGRGHRLLGQYVLARFERADRVLCVQADGQDDVDAIDIVRVGDIVVVIVSVEAGDVVARTQLFGLGAIARHEGGHA